MKTSPDTVGENIIFSIIILFSAIGVVASFHWIATRDWSDELYFRPIEISDTITYSKFKEVMDSLESRLNCIEMKKKHDWYVEAYGEEPEGYDSSYCNNNPYVGAEESDGKLRYRVSSRCGNEMQPSDDEWHICAKEEVIPSKACDKLPCKR